MRWEKLLSPRAKEVAEGRRVAGRKGGAWGPGKRWGHTCNAVRDGRLLYVFGGYGEEHCQTNDVHVFDTVKQLWSKPMIKGVPPTPRDSHTCTTVGNKLFVFGGTDGRKPLRDLHVLDTSTNTWILPIVHGRGPEAREGHGAALVGKRLFIFGGCGKSKSNFQEVYYDDVYILDTENLIWELGVTSGTPPCARDSHTCSSMGNKLIVLGGEDASDRYLSDVYMLDTDTMIWRELNASGEMLAPRAGHSTVVLGRNLLVFGGFTANKNLYDDLHVLNIDTGIWNKVTNVDQRPIARFSAAGDCVDPFSGTLVLIGGCDVGLQPLGDMYYLHTDIRVGNGEGDGRQDKLSLKKELKRKCQESRCENDYTMHKIGMTSDSSQTGTSLYDSNFAKESTFEARVVDRISNGHVVEYTVETSINGHLLRGVLFSTSNPDSTNGRHYHVNKNKKRMGMDNDARLNGKFQERPNAANLTHQAVQNSHVGVIDQVHARTLTTVQSRGETLGSKSMSMDPAYAVAQPETGLEPDPSSALEEVHSRDEHHDCPNGSTREVACEDPAVAEETLPKLPSEEPSSEDNSGSIDNGR